MKSIKVRINTERKENKNIFEIFTAYKNWLNINLDIPNNGLSERLIDLENRVHFLSDFLYQLRDVYDSRDGIYYAVFGTSKDGYDLSLVFKDGYMNDSQIEVMDIILKSGKPVLLYRIDPMNDTYSVIKGEDFIKTGGEIHSFFNK